MELELSNIIKINLSDQRVFLMCGYGKGLYVKRARRFNSMRSSVLLEALLLIQRSNMRTLLFNSVLF